jgi:tetratricopeptide (TPR) repeat protein
VSKRKKKHRPLPKHAPPAPARPRERQGVLLRAARLTCLVGLPALLLLSPSIRYMWRADLGSENSLVQWNCVQVLAAAVAALWLGAVLLGEVPRVRLHRVEIAFVAFFLVELVSSLLTSYHFDSFRRLKEMLAGVVFFVVVKNLFADERRQRLLVRLLMGVLGLLAVVGVVHYLWYVLEIRPDFLVTTLDPNLVSWEKDFGVRATSIAGNPNFLAGNLLVLVPVGLAWLVLHERPRVRLAPAAASALWVVAAAVLLGLTANASSRYTNAETQRYAALASADASPQEQQALTEQAKNLRKSAQTWANVTMVWTVVGVVGLGVMLWLCPFFGTAVAVVLGFALLLFTNSWAGFIGLLVALPLFALLIVLKRPARFRAITAAAVGAGLVAALVAFLVVKGVTKSHIIPPREARTGLRARQLLYDTTVGMIKTRPVLGFGADGFFTYCNKYMSRLLPGPSHYEATLVLNREVFAPDPRQPRPIRLTLLPEANPAPGSASLLVPGQRLVMPKYAAVFINNPSFIARNPGRTHNEYLSVLVETGVIGLGVFAAIFVFFYTGTLGAWRRGDDSWRSVVFLGSSTAIAGVLAMQAFDFPFRLPWATCLIGAALALAAAWHRGWDARLRAKLPVALRAVLLLVVAAAGGFLVVTAVSQARTVQLSSRLAQRQRDLAFPTTEVLNGKRRLIARHSRDHNNYFDLPESLLLLGNLDEVDAYHKTAADYLRLLERIQPFHEKVHFLWGEYWRRKGNADRAVECYRRALELEPRYMKARVLLIDTLVRADRLDEAKAAIEAAWPWQAESQERMERAFGRSAEVKTSAGMALVQPDDLDWPWVMNADATVLALEGDFDAARREWQRAFTTWLAQRPAFPAEQGLTGIYPEVPIPVLNLKLLETTSPEQVTADPATWATKFHGVAEYEAVKLLDDQHRAVLRWPLGLRSGPGPITSPQEAVQRARQLLETIVERYGAGMLSEVAGANLVAIRSADRDGQLTLQPLVSEGQIERIHAFLSDLQHQAAQGRMTVGQYRRALEPLWKQYPHYLPVAEEMLRVLVAGNNRAEADAYIKQLRQWYPDNWWLDLLRKELGL